MFRRFWKVINEKIRDPFVDGLFEAILLLNNVEECYSFFEDITTIGELKALAQRLGVAKMLERNCTYTEIAETTGASTATISRVKRCLNYGADGYKLILERLKEEQNK
jgi:TrpR-related protein YerC/YecD